MRKVEMKKLEKGISSFYYHQGRAIVGIAIGESSSWRVEAMISNTLKEVPDIRETISDIGRLSVDHPEILNDLTAWIKDLIIVRE